MTCTPPTWHAKMTNDCSHDPSAITLTRITRQSHLQGSGKCLFFRYRSQVNRLQIDVDEVPSDFIHDVITSSYKTITRLDLVGFIVAPYEIRCG
jgi:hypothetical protein